MNLNQNKNNITLIVLILIGITIVILIIKAIIGPLTLNIMEVTSPAFMHKDMLPTEYTCDGEGFSPPLNIAQVPEDAKSLALISDDPDAVAGTWVHWLVWNIKPNTSEIPGNSVPQGAIEGTTSFGKTGYGAPCPPSGTHRYFFRFYALDTELNLDKSATREDLDKAMKGHILDKAEIIGNYKGH